MNPTKKTRKIIFYVVVYTAGLLVSLGYIVIKKYGNLQGRIDYKERIEGKINNLTDSVINPQSLHDGEIVWLSGQMTTGDTIHIPVRNERHQICDTFSANVLFAKYEENKWVRSGRRSHSWDTQFEIQAHADSIRLCSLPVDSIIVSHGIGENKVPEYCKMFTNSYSVEITVVPCTTISCIAMWKDGRLCKTGVDDPFVYDKDKNVPAGYLLKHFVKVAENDIDGVMNYLKFFAVLLLVEFAGLFFTRKRNGGDSDLKFLAALLLVEFAEFCLNMKRNGRVNHVRLEKFREVLWHFNLISYGIFAVLVTMPIIMMNIYPPFVDFITDDFGGLSLFMLCSSIPICWFLYGAVAGVLDFVLKKLTLKVL